jgi:hypothetical protein
MDKQLLKAYIRTIVEEEVKRILPELLTEAVRQVKSLTENSNTPVRASPNIDRKRLAQLMNLDYDGDTLRATTSNVPSPNAGASIPPSTPPEVVNALTRDYSALMKKMGLT